MQLRLGSHNSGALGHFRQYHRVIIYPSPLPPYQPHSMQPSPVHRRHHDIEGRDKAEADHLPDPRLNREILSQETSHQPKTLQKIL